MAKNKSSAPKVAVIITVVVVVLLVAIAMLNNRGSNDKVFDDKPSIAGQPILGESNAPVTVIEFGDFMCPACKSWSENILPQLVSDYVDTGQVNFAYVNVLFHGAPSILGSLAAETVLAQNPEHYWDFHHGIFSAQDGDHTGQWMSVNTITEIVSGIPGLNVEQLMTNIEQQTELEKLKIDTELVEKYNIELTPSIMVNDVLIDEPFNYEKIKEIIEKELAEAKANE